MEKIEKPARLEEPIEVEAVEEPLAEDKEKYLTDIAYSLINKPPHTVESVLNALPEEDRERVRGLLEEMKEQPVIQERAFVTAGLGEPKLGMPALAIPRL